MSNIRYLRRKDHRLSEQLFRLRQLYPEAKVYIKRDVLYWDGYLRPTAMSDTYHIQISYKKRYRPKVLLSGDNVRGFDKGNFPHQFKLDSEHKMAQICLHLNGEFNSYMFIADTIIPWTVEWLYFYEIWLATGEWHGDKKPV